MSFRPPPRPAPVRALNAAWGAAARLGVGRTRLDEASLFAAARRASGRHAFRDLSFLEPMRRLLASLEEEARLHPIGRMAMRQTLVRTLATRLGLEALEDLHPEVARRPVEAPVFIVGLQRTGTTLLHRLLTCEPTLRPLYSWEGLSPLPNAIGLGGPAPPAGGRDPRMRRAELAERALRYVAPEFFAIHPVEAHAPEEDVLVMDLSFLSPTVDATLHAPSYSRWFWAADQRPAYEMLRRVIRVLLWQRPGRYLGKTPHHLEQLSALFDVFPDAKVIQTHRDPLRVTASYCSMIAHGRRVFSDHVDAREVGRQLSEGAVRGVTRAMEDRERLGEARFLDVAYANLVADPVEQLRRIYDFLGTELRPATLERMEAFRANNPQHKHGVHRYRLEDFGIKREALSERFEPYRARFDVPEES